MKTAGCVAGVRTPQPPVESEFRGGRRRGSQYYLRRGDGVRESLFSQDWIGNLECIVPLLLIGGNLANGGVRCSTLSCSRRGEGSVERSKMIDDRHLKCLLLPPSLVTRFARDCLFGLLLQRNHSRRTQNHPCHIRLLGHRSFRRHWLLRCLHFHHHCLRHFHPRYRRHLLRALTLPSSGLRGSGARGQRQRSPTSLPACGFCVS